MRRKNDPINPYLYELAVRVGKLEGKVKLLVYLNLFVTIPLLTLILTKLLGG